MPIPALAPALRPLEDEELDELLLLESLPLLEFESESEFPEFESESWLLPFDTVLCGAPPSEV